MQQQRMPPCKRDELSKRILPWCIAGNQVLTNAVGDLRANMLANFVGTQHKQAIRSEKKFFCLVYDIPSGWLARKATGKE